MQHRNETIFFRDLPRHEVQELPREVDVIERHPRHGELLREALRQLRVAAHLERDEHVAESFAVFSRMRERPLELLLGDDVRGDEDLADAHA